MKTRFGRKIDLSKPLTEYPNPQFRRDSFFPLNGEWMFEMNNDPIHHGYYPRKIIVPFSVESPLSGIEEEVTSSTVLHYRKMFRLPEGFNKGRVLIHFDAVDQIADVFLNGVKICHHEGGYLPFTVDCLELKDGDNELLVDVKDDTDSDVFPRGKQRRKRGGIWYTPTSGIWGSVWLESVPSEVIKNIEINPDFDEQKLNVEVFFEGRVRSSSITATYKGQTVARGSLGPDNEVTLDISSLFRPWSPEDPNLYDLEIKVNDDVVHSYFAMRKFSLIEHNGHRVFGLNNKPYFLSGVLDQGYFPDGGLTPPSDEAMVNDIETMKRLGFNTLRKHIKIEPLRWYYHCDRLGMIVIQDMVNGGAPYKNLLLYVRPFLNFSLNDTKRYALLGRKNPKSREWFESDLSATVRHLYNCPCIAVWTLFNEGWGQFDSLRLTSALRSLDSSRLIDSTSGWYDQGGGDFLSRHIYFRAPKMQCGSLRALSLSEFGGYALPIEGHTFPGKKFGYKSIKDEATLTKEISDLYTQHIVPQIASSGLTCTIYTQLSDVEDEVNGLLTYDREILKVDEKTMQELNSHLKF